MPGESSPVNGEEGLTTQSAKTEIYLTLTNKFEVPDDDDSDMRALFVRFAFGKFLSFVVISHLETVGGN